MESNPRDISPEIREFFEKLKQRPGMYIGSQTIYHLRNYIWGMQNALSLYYEPDEIPFNNGHIASIVVGNEDVKVSFQTDEEKVRRKIAILFRNVESIESKQPICGRIGTFTETANDNDTVKYEFRAADTDEVICSITAEKMEVYYRARSISLDIALHNIDYTFVGDQCDPAIYNM